MKKLVYLDFFKIGPKPCFGLSKKRRPDWTYFEASTILEILQNETIPAAHRIWFFNHPASSPNMIILRDHERKSYQKCREIFPYNGPGYQCKVYDKDNIQNFTFICNQYTHELMNRELDRQKVLIAIQLLELKIPLHLF